MQTKLGWNNQRCSNYFSGAFCKHCFGCNPIGSEESKRMKAAAIQMFASGPKTASLAIQKQYADKNYSFSDVKSRVYFAYS